MPIKDVLEILVDALSLSFAPGLLRVLLATKPPGIRELKRITKRSNKILRHNFGNIWAMYLVILEKPDCRPKIYIGSATSMKGARTRLRQYETGGIISDSMKNALKDEYEVTHKYCLCWTPIPSVGLVPVFRTVMIALECAFTFMLWAYRTKKDYRMPQAQLWPVDSFTYDGLCSHICLNEVIPGRHDLTSEEREIYNAEMQRRQPLLKHESYVRIKARDPVAFNAKVAAVQKRLYAKDPKKMNAATKRSRVKNLETGKYRCAICSVSFSDKVKLSRHEKSQAHRERAGLPKTPVVRDKWDLTRDPVKYAATKKKSRAKSVALHKHYCETCDAAFPDGTKLKRHYQTMKHQDAVQALDALGVKDILQS